MSTLSTLFMYSISRDKSTAAILVDVLKLRQMEKLNLPSQEALQTDALIITAW